jgi:hypothetical protein
MAPMSLFLNLAPSRTLTYFKKPLFTGKGNTCRADFGKIPLCVQENVGKINCVTRKTYLGKFLKPCVRFFGAHYIIHIFTSNLLTVYNILEYLPIDLKNPVDFNLISNDRRLLVS